MDLKELQVAVASRSYTLSAEDSLPSAKKCVVSGSDSAQFSEKCNFYFRMHGLIEATECFNSAFYALLNGQYDMLITEESALSNDQLMFVKSLPDDIRSRFTLDGKIIIDNGNLEF